MKRVLLFFFTTLIYSNVIAVDKIQDEFIDCRLGISTRVEVEKTMLKNNFEIVSQDTVVNALYYNGKFTFAGLEFQKIVLKFTNDTLDYFGFGNAFEYNRLCSNDIESDLSKKYNRFEVADSTFFVTLNRNSIEEDDVNTWSRKKDGKVVMLFTTDSYTQCIFAIEPTYAALMDSATNSLKFLAACYDTKNEVKGVGGIHFGDDIQKAKSMLQNKSSEVMISGNQLTGFQTTIAGVTYKYALFTFYDDLGLQKVLLMNEFNSWEKHDAEVQFEFILNQYKSRYTNLQVTKDEEDIKIYSCGMYQSDYDYPPIFIMLKKSIDADTKNITYKIGVSYYTHKQDFNNDDEI